MDTYHMPTPEDAKSWLPILTQVVEHKHSGSIVAMCMTFAAVMLVGLWVPSLEQVPWYVAASLGVGVGAAVALVNHKTPDES